MTGDPPVFFDKPDPWGYQTHPDDIRRKEIILPIARMFGRFDAALDVGAHEGWISMDLPADTVYGYELSDLAAARFPAIVQRVSADDIRGGKFDLVVATGVLYNHYDWRGMVDLINAGASGIILTCNIKQWEVPAAWLGIRGKQVFQAQFPYREWDQQLRVFDVSHQ